jgi:hypothetical protein
MTCTAHGCHALAADGRRQCRHHLELCRAQSKRQRESRKTNGICHACSSRAAPGYVHCPEHRDRYREQSHLRRQRSAATGQCTMDGCTALVVGRSRCEHHLKLQRDREAQKRQTLMVARVCISCGQTSDGKTRCRACAAVSYGFERQRKEHRRQSNQCVYCGQAVVQPAWSRRKRISCDNCRRRLGGYSATLKNRFGRARRTNRRHKGWTLTFEQYTLLLKEPCDYCGLPQDPADTGIGLDRLNNHIGYHIDNVVSCCPVCNMIRNNVFTPDEMKIIGVAVRSIKQSREIHFRPKVYKTESADDYTVANPSSC